MSENQQTQNIQNNRRCVIVAGAGISDYGRIRTYFRDDDFYIFCDSGLRHMEGLGVRPSLVIGDFDSQDDPHLDVETIILPVAKDDTDSVFAAKEGIRRGFRDFLLVGVMGGRMDHTLVNAYLLFSLDSQGAKTLAVDDYSEIEVISSSVKDGVSIPGRACVSCEFPFFSLVNMTGKAKGVTIINAKFPLEDAEITSEYQYATSNEALPGMTAEIEITDGRLLLIRDII